MRRKLLFFALILLISAYSKAQTPNLVITEINYNGPESGSDTTEFIEIYNNDSMTVNLAGYHFVQGFTYTFPAVSINANSYIVLAVDSVKFYNFFGVTAYEWTSGGLSNGGEDIILVNASGDTVDVVDYLVVAKDSALINSVFGISGTYQWTSGGLKNSGEDIEIQNSLGDTIIYVDYDDSSPWPVEADGDGYSMEFCDLNLDNNDGANWEISMYLGAVVNGDSIFGTPGKDCIAVSIEDHLMINNDIIMYPNPATDVIFFNNLLADYDVNIFDVTGSLLIHNQIGKSNNSINIEQLDAGLYFLQFVNIETKKLFIKKLLVQ